jgi:ATP-binding protein involved in chromosome partitioning
MPLNQEQVLAALRTVVDPELLRDIVSLGMVKDLRVDGANVDVTVELTTPACPLKEVIEKDVTNALKRVGAEQVRLHLTANTRGPATPRKDGLPQVKNIVAVGAGKGGVGKSTISLNLAIALARSGASVGLMDGDIYGPSMPTMLGIKGVVPRTIERGVGPDGNPKRKILPIHVHGIHAITIGSLVEQDKPLIWRGPMAHGAFKQLLVTDTEWPELDYLIIDLPPGTGDVPLSLCQMLPLTGAVVVATPQQVALDDAVRALRMFQQLGAPILGMVENMSYIPAADGSVQIDLFGRGGARRAAEQLGVPFLGELPLFPELRANSDTGRPHANFEHTAQLRDALESIAKNLAGEVSKRNLGPQTPELKIS